MLCLRCGESSPEPASRVSGTRYALAILRRPRGYAAIALLGASAALAGACPAAADPWLPHPAGATWKYTWSDSAYNPGGTIENVVVEQQQGASFTLGWADQDHQPPVAGASIECSPTEPPPDIGTVSFQETSAGLINTNWDSCPPPSQMPILCASPTACPNSLSSTMFNVIWGGRVPVISEPLLQGVSWSATGGAQDEVSSSSQDLGLQMVEVPAFPKGVLASVIQSQIVQAGALGDPYGSGIRTVWWVDGVGPVKVVFQHEGGSAAPVTSAYLLSTSLAPATPPPDEDYFPLQVGLSNTYRWTNRKHLPQPEVEQVSVAAVSDRTARVSVRTVSGPIRGALKGGVIGEYGFTTRLEGVTNLWGSTAAQSLAKLPPLEHKRTFLTPVDLMVYGFNPLLPAYAEDGAKWTSGNARSFQEYGVKGTTRIIGVRTVHVPAGTFQALEVQSVLSEHGHPFGSGARTCWFAAGRGLVKLEFRHGDGSVSLVQLIK